MLDVRMRKTFIVGNGNNGKAFMPNTQRDWNASFYKPLLRLPHVQGGEQLPPMVTGANLETLLQAKLEQIAGLSSELGLLRKENYQLTALNRSLVDRVATLEQVLSGEASAKHHYLEQRRSGSVLSSNNNTTSKLQSSSPRLFSQVTETVSKRRLEDMKDTLTA
jgi:hypothetical protein